VLAKLTHAACALGKRTSAKVALKSEIFN
jgi:hypothetical protein